MSVEEDLERISAKKVHSKKINMAAAFLHSVAMNSVATFDSHIQHVTESVDAAKMLNTSEISKTLQKLGYELSLKGNGYGLVQWMVNGAPHVDVVEFSDYLIVAGIMQWANINTLRTIVHNGIPYQITVRFDKTPEGIIKSEGIVVNKEFYLIDENIIRYPGSLIPAWPFENNSLGFEDIPKAMRPMLDELDFFGSQIKIEYNKIRTQFINNKLYGSLKSGKDWDKAMENGDSTHDVADPDSQLQGALRALISGSTTPTIVLQNIQFIEDKILKFSSQYRETDSGGQNKHNLEVSMENQQAFEYMNSKLEWRAEQLNKFYSIISENNGWDPIVATISLPTLEAMKIANMQAEIELKSSQSAQYRATAQLQSAQAAVVVPVKEVSND